MHFHLKRTNCEWDPTCDIKLIAGNNKIEDENDQAETDQKDQWIDCQVCVKAEAERLHETRDSQITQFLDQAAPAS